jgi:aspartate 1-decarboxylase
VTNGARFVTYVIEGESGSGTVQVNGAAAHLVRESDVVIVASFASYDERDLEAYAPIVVHVNDRNEVLAVDSNPEVLLRGTERLLVDDALSGSFMPGPSPSETL